MDEAAAAAPTTRADDIDPAPFIRRFFPACRNIAEFEQTNKISEGTYGVVCM